jgi:hypothetical protein
MTLNRRTWNAGLLTAMTWPAWAALPKPAGRVILSVKGQVAPAHAAGGADFDDAMLAAMPQRTLNTRTPWHEGVKKFTGPLLRDVLSAVGAKGQTIRAVALNDYKVDIPFEDAQKIDVVMARLLDDKPMPVRDKGPLFIIYPFDDRPELRTPQYYSRCAWQLRTIEIV